MRVVSRMEPPLSVERHDLLALRFEVELLAVVNSAENRQQKDRANCSGTAMPAHIQEASANVGFVTVITVL